MVKLSTQVNPGRLPVRVSLSDRILVLGSCFIGDFGKKLSEAGFNVLVNPFGNQYNPASVLSALELLEGEGLFGEKDCVEMGAGAGMVCSYSHHSSFARPTASEFLEVANASLTEARKFWKECNCLMINYDNSFVWEINKKVISNCLKRPSSEFTHRRLSPTEVSDLTEEICRKAGDRKMIFTISPVRHLSEGPLASTLSKGTLAVGLDDCPDPRAKSYFPAYEIMTDELRDYRFYADDLIHPSETAMEIIFGRFLECAVPEEEWTSVEEARRAFRRSAHRRLLP